MWIYVMSNRYVQNERSILTSASRDSRTETDWSRKNFEWSRARPFRGHTCFLGDGEEVCEDDDELVNDGEWRGESQLELEEESHEDDDPTKPPPNCWRADVITSK